MLDKELTRKRFLEVIAEASAMVSLGQLLPQIVLAGGGEDGDVPTATPTPVPSPVVAIPSPTPVPTPTGFAPEGAFRFFQIARPDIVGVCLEEAHPNGLNLKELVQRTTKGEYVFKDGLTLFNNGNITYELGDRAIYQRPLAEEIQLVVNHIYTEENTFALTLDDGVSEEAVRAMAEAITSTGNRATFFINGIYYRAYRDLILEIDKTGMITWANHTDTHPLNLVQLSQVGAWDQIRKEVSGGDPKVNIPELTHVTNFFRFPGFSSTLELRKFIVFDLGLTICDADQGNYDYTNHPQAFVDGRLLEAQAGQVFYGHLLPRHLATFKDILIEVNRRGLRGEDLDSVLVKSTVRHI